MPSITLDLPEDALPALSLGPNDCSKELRLAAAAHWYDQGRLSGGKAAQVAGLDSLRFLDELSSRHVSVFQVDLKDLAAEVDRA